MSNNHGCLWVIAPLIVAAILPIGLIASLMVIRSNYELGMAGISATAIIMVVGIAALGDDE